MKYGHFHYGVVFTAFTALAAPVYSQSTNLPPPAVAAPNTSPADLGKLPPLTLPPTPLVANPSGAANPTNSGLPTAPISANGSQPSSAISTLTKAIANAASDSSLPPPVAAPKVYSYGDSNLSILFLPDQVTKMKEAIRAFDDTGKVAEAAQPVIDTQTAAPIVVPIEDPLSLPVFYLASIAYDTPSEWSLWISGYKITSRKNDTDVTVLNVSPGSATFLWTPSFSKALMRRQREKLFAPVDAVKNRLAGLQRASFNEETGAVTFTIKPNQSFAVGYFDIFEGFIDTPTLTPLPLNNPNGSAVDAVNSDPSVSGDPTVPSQPPTDPGLVGVQGEPDQNISPESVSDSRVGN